MACICLYQYVRQNKKTTTGVATKHSYIAEFQHVCFSWQCSSVSLIMNSGSGYSVYHKSRCAVQVPYYTITTCLTFLKENLCHSDIILAQSQSYGLDVCILIKKHSSKILYLTLFIFIISEVLQQEFKRIRLYFQHGNIFYF